ncbi:unnamed protein product [Calypogeia fissa]
MNREKTPGKGEKGRRRGKKPVEGQGTGREEKKSPLTRERAGGEGPAAKRSIGDRSNPAWRPPKPELGTGQQKCTVGESTRAHQHKIEHRHQGAKKPTFGAETRRNHDVNREHSIRTRLKHGRSQQRIVSRVLGTGGG